jgi:quinol monooxygenase YgiN
MLGAVAAMLPIGNVLACEEVSMEEVVPDYGLIGQIIAAPGQRAALADIMRAGTGGMPGNFGYLIGEDSVNPDALWIIEIWETKAHHEASLQLPQIQAVIARARPIIAGFGETRIEFKPLGKADAPGA